MNRAAPPKTDTRSGWGTSLKTNGSSRPSRSCTGTIALVSFEWVSPLVMVGSTHVLPQRTVRKTFNGLHLAGLAALLAQACGPEASQSRSWLAGVRWRIPRKAQPPPFLLDLHGDRLGASPCSVSVAGFHHGMSIRSNQPSPHCRPQPMARVCGSACRGAGRIMRVALALKRVKCWGHGIADVLSSGICACRQPCCSINTSNSVAKFLDAFVAGQPIAVDHERE